MRDDNKEGGLMAEGASKEGRTIQEHRMSEDAFELLFGVILLLVSVMVFVNAVEHLSPAYQAASTIDGETIWENTASSTADLPRYKLTFKDADGDVEKEIDGVTSFDWSSSSHGLSYADGASTDGASKDHYITVPSDWYLEAEAEQEA